jgi:predicted transcriptional regulator
MAAIHMTLPLLTIIPAKKSPAQIRFDILEFLYNHAGMHLRTSVWRHATRLSYDDFQRYLGSLNDKGFVEEFEGGIRLTLAGKKIYLRLRELLPSVL